MSKFYEKMDQEHGAALLDAFIAVVNADHDDVIEVTRTHACYMRDEIERLRKAAGKEANQ